MSAMPRGQGHALCMTPGPRLLLRSVPGQRRGRRGEEDDPIAGVADAWGPVGSGCGSGASRRGEAVRAGRWDPAVSVCVRAGGEAKLGRLRGPRTRVGGQAGWLARPSRPGLLLLPILSFLFFYSFFYFVFHSLLFVANLFRVGFI